VSSTPLTAPLLILSHFGDPPRRICELIAAGCLTARREWDVSSNDIVAASGILTTMHLDQIRAMEWQDAFVHLLDAGGRIAINGHIARPFIPGLEPFAPLARQTRTDLAFDILADHPIFLGVDRLAWRFSRGVAGFYGRGHNPMPDGGIALTGISPERQPLDWVWHRPRGGSVFSHAGNDIWGMTGDEHNRLQVIDNLVAWASGRSDR
jgi:hypothetical protein